MNKKSGIYAIKNLENGKVYVGISSDISKRITNHKTMLRGNRHDNFELQSDWNKQQGENFKFEVLEYCSLKDMKDLEREYICDFDSCNNGYNIQGENLKKYTDLHIRRTHYITKDNIKFIDSLYKNNNQDKSETINRALNLYREYCRV